MLNTDVYYAFNMYTLQLCYLQEVNVIEGIKDALQAKVSQAFEQLCLLREARQQLAADLRDKTEAKGIDTYCKELTINSPDICLQPNPTRTPKG